MSKLKVNGILAFSGTDGYYPNIQVADETMTRALTSTGREKYTLRSANLSIPTVSGKKFLPVDDTDEAKTAAETACVEFYSKHYGFKGKKLEEIEAPQPGYDWDFDKGTKTKLLRNGVQVKNEDGSDRVFTLYRTIQRGLAGGPNAGKILAFTKEGWTEVTQTVGTQQVNAAPVGAPTVTI